MIAYTKRLTVYRRSGDIAVQVHVDPRGLLGVGDTYDAELVLPATGAAHPTPAGQLRPRSVAGVARGTTATVGCALPQLPDHHCVAVHVCALKVTIRRPSDPEDVDVHTLPVEIEHREMGLIGR